MQQSITKRIIISPNCFIICDDFGYNNCMFVPVQPKIDLFNNKLINGSFNNDPLPEERRQPGGRCGCFGAFRMIDITPPFDAAEIEKLAQRLHIPLDYLTDSLDIDERSRYEYEDEEDIRLIVVNTPILNEIDKENEAIYITVPIGIIITPEHFITITAFDNPVLKRFRDAESKISTRQIANYSFFS